MTAELRSAVRRRLRDGGDLWDYSERERELFAALCDENERLETALTPESLALAAHGFTGNESSALQLGEHMARRLRAVLAGEEPR